MINKASSQHARAHRISTRDRSSQSAVAALPQVLQASSCIPGWSELAWNIDETDLLCKTGPGRGTKVPVTSSQQLIRSSLASPVWQQNSVARMTLKSGIHLHVCCFADDFATARTLTAGQRYASTALCGPSVVSCPVCACSLRILLHQHGSSGAAAATAAFPACHVYPSCSSCCPPR